MGIYRIDHHTCFIRACDLGLAGVVVHANRIRPISEWKHLSPLTEREKVVSCLLNVINGKDLSSSTWIGLENMPIMDNAGDLIDPSFVFIDDFNLLKGTGVGVTWDMCHYLNTLETVKEVLAGNQPMTDYPNLQY